MLKLEKPRTINGVDIYPDHEDPQLFYYLPSAIALADTPNKDEKVFHLWMYRDDPSAKTSQNGGFLNFEVNLRLDKKVENSILDQLTKDGMENPRLISPRWSEGSVKCIGLDINSTTKQFVVETDVSTIPSLTVDNSAIFSLSLSQKGAVIAKNAFKAKTSPIGVIYNLKYTALTPALDVKVTGSYKQVYKHFSQSLSAQYEMTKLDIDTGFEKLIKDKAINIEVSQYVPDDEKNNMKEWALELFKAQIVSQWFEPTLTPGSFKSGLAKAEAIDEVQKRAKQGEPAKEEKPAKEEEKPAKEIIAAASGIPIVSYSLKYLHQEELGEIDMNFHSEEAQIRTCAPQGFLGLFAKELDFSKYVSEFDLDDPFYRILSINVAAPNNFEELGLISANVRMKYGQDSDEKSFYFTKGSEKLFCYKENLNKNLDRKYKYDITFDFAQSDDWDGSSYEYSFNNIESESTVLSASPYEFLIFKNIEIRLRPKFNWPLVDYVEVICNYENSTGWKAEEKIFTFVEPNYKDNNISEVKSWKIRLNKKLEFTLEKDKMYKYQIKYYLTSGKVIETEEMYSDSTLKCITIPNPKIISNKL